MSTSTGFAILNGMELRATRRALLGGILTPLLARTAMPLAQPAFQVDVPAPTKDKPQSKLWFAYGAWWAWLPVRGGSSIWKRTTAGWRRETALDAALRGYPGQADVWAADGRVDAVLVAPDQLAVAALLWDAGRGAYRLAAEPHRFPMGLDSGSRGGVETATIARDGRGLWIAYNWQSSMWVRASHGSGSGWTEPMRINTTGASADDICAIVRIHGAVGVLWSDQVHDAVYFRLHADGAPDDAWSAAEVAQSGGKTADDHINAITAKDGTLYVATKNSVDLVGQPQLVLRMRDPQGKWTNLPYADRLRDAEPTRPIAVLAGKPPRLYLVHTVGLRGTKPPQSRIVYQVTGTARPDLAGESQILIDAGRAVNNVTRAKAMPDSEPAMVLASDNEGNVYEARLP